MRGARGAKFVADVPEFRLVAVVSTCHVTRADALLLDVNGYPVMGQISDGAGALVYIPPVDRTEEWCGDDPFKRFSVHLCRVVRAMQNAGATYVLFDRDGPVLRGFKKFNW